MGVHYDEIAALDAAYHLPTYARKPVLFTRGEGMRLYDDEGREYLDFLAGIGAVLDGVGLELDGLTTQTTDRAGVGPATAEGGRIVS